MEFEVLGWPPNGPTLRLDYRRFAYAGKFVMSNTGKAVVRGPSADPGGNTAMRERGDSGEIPRDVPDADDFETGIVAALAFNADRTDDTTLWYRYVTVRSDVKGSGIGPRLAAFTAPRAAARGYERLRIAVNNPFAYEAMHKAGFRWTGRETGLAELVLERPAEEEMTATESDGVPTDVAETADADRYQAGLDRFRERDLGEEEAIFLQQKRGADPPALITQPTDPEG
jgi:GNAT superfamily N-acetyltransferase